MAIRKPFQKIIKFFKEVKLEMQKVTWPSKKEIFKNTLIIIGVSLALSIFLGGLDFVFTRLLEKFIL
jgi:preprotein translocase subunit SecE